MASQEPFQRVSSAGGMGSPPEKPFHYTYLKEFRVEQCKLFLQHKCTQHRPYTCFYWHFMNQRRRRPVRRRDGTFNYSPDMYCNTYDENTGICQNGDECPYLHRNAGDTERRYHLRYYKTSTCVYETDSRGFCVKNGPHCAFAHGPHDLRSPVYDIRELVGEGEEDRLVSPLVGSLEREKGVLVDDPRWHESSFVLTYYKTEPCKRPPRLCRQGYACPFYHNNKDRRRGPKTYKYRSTPCPNVKVNDEWSDPANCDQGDLCPYCHTRTEQQFHPEIYKSTRCNDVQATGYCPRGPFCAFAHDDKELSAPRELTDEPMMLEVSPTVTGVDPFELMGKSIPQPIGSHRPSSSHTPTSQTDALSFRRAPGADRCRSTGEDDNQAYIRKQLQAIESDSSLDEGEKQRRKQSLLRLSFGSMGAAAVAGFSPDTTTFQPGSLPSSVSDALEAVVGQGVDDLSLDDLETGMPYAGEGQPGGTESEVLGGGMMGQSPVAQGFMQSLQSPFSSSLGYSTPLGPLSPFPGPQPMAPHPLGLVPASPLAGMSSPGTTHSRAMSIAQLPGGDRSEVLALREELRQARMNISSWQEQYGKAKQACDAWKREAEDLSHRMQQTERERQQASKEKAELEDRVCDLELQVQSSQLLRTLVEGANLSQLSLTQLESIRQQIRKDLDKVDQTVTSRKGVLCTRCNEQPRSVVLQPCQHCVLCQKCVDNLPEPVCPYCNARIAQRVPVLLPSL